MDIIAFNEAATANGRIEKFIENPDSNSGVLTQPKVIEAGETVTIKSGRQAILADTVVDGNLVIEAGGDVFVPAGAGFGDLENQINTKATKQETNITVNVGAGQTYTTINQALEYLSGLYPMYKKSGVTATINLKAGFVMAEQVLVSGIDLGWITIVGEDAETIITHTALITSFYGDYPAFGVDKGGTSPVIGQLFRFNVEKVGGNKHGLMTWGAGSSANIIPGKGFIGAGTNGIYIVDGSTINARGANCSNAGTNGIIAVNSSIINAYGANCSNSGNAGIVANSSSTINANGANCSNAVYSGVNAEYGSTITAYNIVIQNQTSGSARVVVRYASHIEVVGINATGGTAPVFSQAVNTLTGNGIIYQ